MKLSQLISILGALALTTVITGCNPYGWFSGSKDSCRSTKSEVVAEEKDGETAAEEVKAEQSEACEHKGHCEHNHHEEESHSDVK